MNCVLFLLVLCKNHDYSQTFAVCVKSHTPYSIIYLHSEYSWFHVTSCDHKILLNTRYHFDSRNGYSLVTLRCCYTRQFFLQLAMQRHCETSCRRNCTCNTPSLQLVSQRKIARRVAGKVEQSTFRNVAWSVAACNIYLATCNDLLSSALHCKLQEKLPRVTGPLVKLPFFGLSSHNFGEVAITKNFLYFQRSLYGAAMLDDMACPNFGKFLNCSYFAKIMTRNQTSAAY